MKVAPRLATGQTPAVEETRWLILTIYLTCPFELLLEDVRLLLLDGNDGLSAFQGGRFDLVAGDLGETVVSVDYPIDMRRQGPQRIRNPDISDNHRILIALPIDPGDLAGKGMMIDLIEKMRRGGACL